jgi:isopentenyl-diphosphate delta-isomerase
LSAAEERVVLVDEHDREVGTAEKMAAHREPRLHRAFSVLVFHPERGLLLQRRAAGKYHSPGLWTNTCCSHPRPGETVTAAAARRLGEEMGMTCDLTPAFTFVYRAELDQGLTEHEYDHVLVGYTRQPPRPNPAEADGWRWTPLTEVLRDLERRPQAYTAWFRILMERFAPAGEAHLHPVEPGFYRGALRLHTA